jgi:hypothetical protein
MSFLAGLGASIGGSLISGLFDQNAQQQSEQAAAQAAQQAQQAQYQYQLQLAQQAQAYQQQQEAALQNALLGIGGQADPYVGAARSTSPQYYSPTTDAAVYGGSAMNQALANAAQSVPTSNTQAAGNAGAATSAPNTSSGPAGSTSSSGYTPAQEAAIVQAVDSTFTPFASETAGALDGSISSKLQQSGLFSPAQLAQISQGENAAEGHGQSFVEQNKGGGNTAGFDASWIANINKALGGAAPSTTATSTPSQTSGGSAAPVSTPQSPTTTTGAAPAGGATGASTQPVARSAGNLPMTSLRAAMLANS